MYLFSTYLYVLLITNKNNFMQHFSNILLVSQFLLFVIILSNMARLVSDYLITKIK